MSEDTAVVRAYEQLAAAHEASGAFALMHAYRQAAEQLRTQSPKPPPRQSEGVELYVQTGAACLGKTQPYAPVYERIQEAEAVIDAARRKRLLREMLKSLGPSADGAVERDLASADDYIDEALAALDSRLSRKEGS